MHHLCFKKKQEIDNITASIITLENCSPVLMNEAEFNKFMSKARKEIKLKNYHNFKEWLSLFIKEIRVGEDDITVILSYKKIVTKLGGGDESRTRVQK